MDAKPAFTNQPEFAFARIPGVRKTRPTSAEKTPARPLGVTKATWPSLSMSSPAGVNRLPSKPGSLTGAPKNHVPWTPHIQPLRSLT
jgi:hypothetical protein